jgi:hypothetical protein
MKMRKKSLGKLRHAPFGQELEQQHADPVPKKSRRKPKANRNNVSRFGVASQTHVLKPYIAAKRRGGRHFATGFE